MENLCEKYVKLYLGSLENSIGIKKKGDNLLIRACEELKSRENGSGIAEYEERWRTVFEAQRRREDVRITQMRRKHPKQRESNWDFHYDGGKYQYICNYDPPPSSSIPIETIEAQGWGSEFDEPEQPEEMPKEIQVAAADIRSPMNEYSPLNDEYMDLQTPQNSVEEDEMDEMAAPEEAKLAIFKGFGHLELEMTYLILSLPCVPLSIIR